MRSKTILILLIFATTLLVIKVYISNEIYYTSRDIQKLSQQINALKEERNILKLKIEKLKYKNTIVDPLFNYMPPKERRESNMSVVEASENGLQKEKNQTERIKPKDAKELFKTIHIEDRF